LLIRRASSLSDSRDRRSDLETNGIDERIFSNELLPCWPISILLFRLSAKSDRLLGRRPLDLVRNRRAADRDASRFHGFRDLAHQVDDQKAVFEAGALNLDVVGERELALKRPRGNPAMQEELFFLLSLAAFEGQHVLLDGQRDFLRRESCQSDRNLEPVLAGPFNVVRGIRLFAGPLDLVENVEKTVEADGRPPEGSPINTS
jgi:hypothetical protein